MITNNINYIFITGLFPDEIIDDIYVNSKGIIENAANNFQWNIVNGFAENKISSSYIINAPFVGSYPRLYNKYKIKKCSFKNKLTSNAISISFLNIRPFKSFSIKRNLVKYIFSAVSVEKQNIIIVYSSNKSFLDCAIKIKEKYSNIKICLILPDLPIFMSSRSNLYYKLRGEISQSIFQKQIKNIDYFVLLTKEMAKYLKIENRQYLIIEGILDYNKFANNAIVNKPELINKDKFIILYSGSISKRYGIMTLINAFKNIKNDEFILWICGEGDAKNDIINLAKIDKRVKYWGQIDVSHVHELQSKASLLINPRSANDEYTKYSFPSKTIEYLVSGTPVLMNKLPCLTDDYYDYIFFYNETSESLATKILELKERGSDYLIEFGDKAKNFVLNNKNSYKQCGKILKMLNDYK